MEKLARIMLATGGAAAVTVAFAVVANETFVLDKPHSAVGFTVPIAGGLSHMRGRFNGFRAQIKYRPNDLTHSSVKATIDVATLDTGVPGRDKHTLGAAGFDAAKYPQILFASKRIEKSGQGFNAIGDLTMRGVKKEVVIPFHQTGTRTLGEGMSLIGFEGKLRLDRRDYGLRWEMPGDARWVGDLVDIDFSVLARPQ